MEGLTLPGADVIFWMRAWFLSQCIVMTSSIDVLVIGAGISGLAAARRLTNYGGFNVTVLEARPDRYGGRAFTDETLGVPVDLGATWIHGSSPSNPLTRLARHAHLNLLTVDAMNALRFAPKDKDNLAPDLYSPDLYLQRSVDFIQMMLSVSEMSQAWKEDVSVQDAAHSASFTKALADPYMLLLSSDVIMSRTGASLANISAKLLDAGESMDGPEQLVTQGFSRIVDILVSGFEGEAPIEVTQGSVVEAINVRNKTVEVVTYDGEYYHGDTVIVTVPLGVLKKKYIQFDPELPDTKLKAIDKLGFGVQEKLVLEFDQVFWPEDKMLFSLAPATMADAGFLNTWLNLRLVTERPILMGVMDGPRAISAKDLTDKQLQREGLAVLTKMFGASIVGNRTVRAMLRTNWYSDPFARGSASYYSVGSSQDDRLDLASSVGPRLFFAGEHTSPGYFGTAHGAYFSGLRAAGEVLSEWAIPVPTTNQPLANPYSPTAASNGTHTSHVPGVSKKKGHKGRKHHRHHRKHKHKHASHDSPLEERVHTPGDKDTNSHTMNDVLGGSRSGSNGTAAGTAVRNTSAYMTSRSGHSTSMAHAPGGSRNVATDTPSGIGRARPPQGTSSNDGHLQSHDKQNLGGMVDSMYPAQYVRPHTSHQGSKTENVNTERTGASEAMRVTTVTPSELHPTTPWHRRHHPARELPTEPQHKLTNSQDKHSPHAHPDEDQYQSDIYDDYGNTYYDHHSFDIPDVMPHGRHSTSTDPNNEEPDEKSHSSNMSDRQVKSASTSPRSGSVTTRSSQLSSRTSAPSSSATVSKASRATIAMLFFVIACMHMCNKYT